MRRAPASARAQPPSTTAPSSSSSTRPTPTRTASTVASSSCSIARSPAFRTAASACPFDGGWLPAIVLPARALRNRPASDDPLSRRLRLAAGGAVRLGALLRRGRLRRRAVRRPRAGCRAAGPWTGDAAGLGAPGGRGARSLRNRTRHHPGHLARRLPRAAGGGVRAAHRAGDRLRRPRRLLRLLHGASGRAAGGHADAR